jgi:hypothetical protein
MLDAHRLSEIAGLEVNLHKRTSLHCNFFSAPSVAAANREVGDAIEHVPLLRAIKQGPPPKKPFRGSNPSTPTRQQLVCPSFLETAQRSPNYLQPIDRRNSDTEGLKNRVTDCTVDAEGTLYINGIPKRRKLQRSQSFHGM